MADKLHRFLLENLHIRGEWVQLESAWQSIRDTADYPPPVERVLGEALAAVSLLAESLKFDGSLVMQIQGTQPVTMLVVQATSDGGLRGIAHWQGEITEDASFNDLFGAGTMVITVENKPQPGQQQGERYQSLVALQGASLADCLGSYFAQSEQLNTRLWLAADKQRVAGVMLQSLPADSTIKPEVAEENWQHATALAETLTDQELLTLDASELLHRLYHEEDLRLYDAVPLHFACTCSQQKIENAIYSMGEQEARGILAEQGKISIDCEFCNQHYELDSIDIERIFPRDGVPHGTQQGANKLH